MMNRCPSTMNTSSSPDMRMKIQAYISKLVPVRRLVPGRRERGASRIAGVVSLPVTARNAARVEEDGRAAGRKKAAAAEARPSPVPNGPAEALDRISVAPEAMARIAEVLSTGGSIIVSDLGVNQGGETGEGTDFIVPLR